MLARSLRPPRPVLDRLGQVRRPDVGRSRQVGDRAGQLEHAVVGPRREVQLAHRRLHQPLPGAVERAVRAHLGRPHIGVGQQPGATEALGLAHARRRDPLAHGAGGLALPFRSQFFVIHAWHLDVDVDPVEQRAGDALLVARDNRGRVGAGLLAVAVIAAWAGMETKHQF
jgi:hypothetical protein